MAADTPRFRPPCIISPEWMNHSHGTSTPSLAVTPHSWGGVCNLVLSIIRLAMKIKKKRVIAELQRYNN